MYKHAIKKERERYSMFKQKTSGQVKISFKMLMDESQFLSEYETLIEEKG